MSKKHSEEPTIPDFIDLIIKERKEEAAIRRQEEDKFWDDYCESEDIKSHPVFIRRARG